MTREELIKYLANSNIKDSVFSLLIHTYISPTCDDCEHYLSQDGKYPIDPCSECSRFYGDMFERREDV